MSFAAKRRQKKPPPPPPPPTAPEPPTSTFYELFGLSSSLDDIPPKSGLAQYIMQGYLQAIAQHTLQTKGKPAQQGKLLARQCEEHNSVEMDCTNNKGCRQHYHLTDYAPKAFEYMRRLSSITEQQHLATMKSIQGDPSQGEGKSGMLFFTSADQQYVLKTLKSAELPVMLKLLPHYIAHFDRYRCSLLPRFYGLTTFTFPKGQHNQNKYILIIMENVLRPKQLHSGWFSRQPKVHEIYDLKGSTKGRVVRRNHTSPPTAAAAATAAAVQRSGTDTSVGTKTKRTRTRTRTRNKATTPPPRKSRAATSATIETTPAAPTTVLKDLDMHRRLIMDPKRRTRFFTQLREDVNLLILHNLMDYSLLLGISFHGGSDACRRASTEFEGLSSAVTPPTKSSLKKASNTGSNKTGASSTPKVQRRQTAETVGSTGISLHAVVNRVYGANTRMDELLPSDTVDGTGKYTLQCFFQGRSIVKERNKSPYIAYHIKMIKTTTIVGRWSSNTIDKQSWMIYRRYSDFLRLRALLNAELSVTGYSTVVSPLPPKVWLGNFDSSILNQRQNKLNHWCNVLLNVFTSRIIQTSLPLKIFLTRNADEPPLGMSRRSSGSGSGKNGSTDSMHTWVHPAAKQSMRVARATDVDSGSRVTLFIGMIDILQTFNLTKRMEASIKGRLSHPLAVSATDAQSYGKRFVEYLGTVLPPS